LAQRLSSTTLVKAFTLFGSTGTLTKLMEMPPYKPTDSLNGVRVISMAWIILGHTFLMPTGISGYQNQEDIVMSPLNSDAAEANPLFQVIPGAQAGVDTFFFLSGFLLAYLTLKELRRGKVNVLAAIALRYLRLTPSLGLVMMVFYKIWQYFGHGPFAVTFQNSITSRCDGSWWSELTYTMNFVPFDSNKVCMGWTWYLGDDMIFFIIAILLIPVYHRMKVAGWSIMLMITLASFTVTTWLVVRYNLSIYIFDHHYQDYSYYSYSKPYCRIPGYFVGVAGGWVLDELEQRGITRETRPTTFFARMSAWVASVVALVVLVTVVLIPYTDFGNHKDSWGALENVLYINFGRVLFSMCWLVWTILCYYDYLPLVNGVLSHRYWTPFARLTYGAYLVHPLVIKLAAGRSTQFYTFNTMDIIYRFIGNFFLAFSGSLALWVLCERPCMTIFSPARKPRTNGAASAEKPGTSPQTEAGPPLTHDISLSDQSRPTNGST